MEGFATLGTLVSDTTYFLSPSTAGLLTSTEPTTVGQISKPVLKTTSTTTGIINNMRGMEITAASAANADALNSATTTVNVSSATAPSSGQVLTATSSTAATWQTPASPSLAS